MSVLVVVAEGAFVLALALVLVSVLALLVVVASEEVLSLLPC